jgi:hypothetical protein
VPLEHFAIGVLTASMTNTKVVWRDKDQCDKMLAQGSCWERVFLCWECEPQENTKTGAL